MNAKKMMATMISTGLLAFSVHSYAAGALSVNKEIIVDAAPATVWKMVGNFNGLDVWHPVVVGSELVTGINDNVGAERLLTLGNGATIKEKLLDYSEKNQSYSYAILESPLPVKNYESTVQVSAAENGKTKVSWSSSFDASGASNDDAVNAITGVYDAGLNQVQHNFAK